MYEVNGTKFTGYMTAIEAAKKSFEKYGRCDFNPADLDWDNCFISDD